MQNEIIEIGGQPYKFRTVGCLYGLYEVEKGPFEDGQKVPGADLALGQFSVPFGDGGNPSPSGEARLVSRGRVRHYRLGAHEE